MEQRSEKSIVEKLLNQAMNTSTYFLCFNKQNKKWEVKTTKSLNTLLKITLIFNPNEQPSVEWIKYKNNKIIFIFVCYFIHTKKSRSSDSISLEKETRHPN